MRKKEIIDDNNKIVEDKLSDDLPQKSKKSFGYYFSIVILIMILGVLFLYYQSTKSLNLENPSQEDINSAVMKISRLIDLPFGEIPSLVNVTDKNLLSKDPFFQNTKNGDQILLYPRAGKIYVYDPKANIVINVANININR